MLLLLLLLSPFSLLLAPFSDHAPKMPLPLYPVYTLRYTFSRRQRQLERGER